MHTSDAARAHLERIKAEAIAQISSPTFKDRSDNNIQSSEFAEPNTTCEACSRLLATVSRFFDDAQESGFVKFERIALSHSYAELRLSAQLGCHMCSVLERGALQYLLDGRLSPISLAGDDKDCAGCIYLSTIPEWLSKDQPTVKLQLSVYWSGTSTLTNNAGMFYVTQERDDVPQAVEDSFQLETPLAYDTGHSQVLQAASHWLSTCRSEHEGCRPIRPAEPNVPRRLLRLDDTYAYIVDNTGQFEYTCLSHCWGSQENVPRQLFEKGPQKPFEISKLPKTFREAMDVTKRLGFKYIWIDCFCIVQSSVSDWLEQSAVMAQIYAHSVVTIAALSSKSVLGGCFVSRNPLENHALRARGLVVRERPYDKLRLCRLELDGDIDRHSPLHTRGWVVQERLAARRTIFFGQKGIYWECNSMIASENGYQTVESGSSSNVKSLVHNLQHAALKSAEERQYGFDETMFEKIWAKVVENYSACDLTRHTDKLIALSGITNDVAKIAGRIYIQGLWAENLAEGLLWYHEFSPRMAFRVLSGKRVETGGFPSWTWASMQGKISYMNLFGRIVWRAPIEVDNNNSTRLRLTTWIRRIELDEEGEITVPDDGSKHGDPNDYHGWWPDEKEPVDEPRWIVPVLRLAANEDGSRGSNACIVVRRLENNVYCRVGVVLVRFSSVKDDVFSRDEPKAPDNVVILA